MHLDAAVADVFGYHALQLGLPELDALRENRMPLRLCAADRWAESLEGSKENGGDGSGGGSRGGVGRSRIAVINRYEELPFASSSIDLVVLPHVLEFADEPHQVLREVDRVLVPEGHVVITGFNPASLWGMRHALTRLGLAAYVPAQAQFIGVPRLKDWLKLLSFEPHRGRFGCYVPWARSRTWLARWAFMEKAGDRWWPVLGAVYLLTAVKRVSGMHLVGRIRRWREREGRVATLAPVASSISRAAANDEEAHQWVQQ